MTLGLEVLKDGVSSSSASKVSFPVSSKRNYLPSPVIDAIFASCASLAIFSFVSLHALIWRFSVNSRFSLFRSAFGRVVTLLSYLAVCEVTFYPNVP